MDLTREPIVDGTMINAVSCTGEVFAEIFIDDSRVLIHGTSLLDFCDKLDAAIVRRKQSVPEYSIKALYCQDKPTEDKPSPVIYKLDMVSLESMRLVLDNHLKPYILSPLYVSMVKRLLRCNYIQSGGIVDIFVPGGETVTSEYLTYRDFICNLRDKLRSSERGISFRFHVETPESVSITRIGRIDPSMKSMFLEGLDIPPETILPARPGDQK